VIEIEIKKNYMLFIFHILLESNVIGMNFVISIDFAAINCDLDQIYEDRFAKMN
jgi:hypothetical protein